MGSVNTVLSAANAISAVFASIMVFWAATRGSRWLLAPRVSEAVALLAFACGWGLRTLGVLSPDESSVYLRGTAVTVCLTLCWVAFADVKYEQRIRRQAAVLEQAANDGETRSQQ